MENIPILEGISPDEVEQMRVCFGVREERFRADTVIYDISEGRGELGLLTAGSCRHPSALTGRGDVPFWSIAHRQRVRRDADVRKCGRGQHHGGGGGVVPGVVHERRASDPAMRKGLHPSQPTGGEYVHIMTDKAAALSERVEVLSRRSIREKLLCYFGLQTGGDDCGSFHLPFTLSALADYISADRSAMMRELRKMKEEHLVDIDRGQVTLHHALA